MKNLILIFLFVFFIVNGYSQTFQDSPGNETDGTVPSKWSIIKGSAEIATEQGEKIIALTDKSVITPLANSSDYLQDRFNLEFEAYFARLDKAIYYYQYYQIRFWDGAGNVTTTFGDQTGFYQPIDIYRNGAVVIGREGSSTKIFNRVTNKELENKEVAWRLVNIDYNKGVLKITIDGYQILNIPNFNFKPQMISIGAIYNQTNQGYPRAIKNIHTIGINLPSPSEPENLPTETPITETPTTESDSTTVVAGSGLEAIDEGNGRGWRLKGRDPNNYGNIGLNAVDFSFSDDNFEIHGPKFEKGATGESSFAMGYRALASGDHSTSIGYWPSNTSKGGIAIGYAPFVYSDSCAIAIGYKPSATKNFTLAIGSKVEANGEYSIAIGHAVKATDINSTAIGNGVKAEGRSSSAMGQESIASKNYATAIGNKSKASGEFSLAIGSNTTSSGIHATVIGSGSEASGEFSLAAGRGSFAEGKTAIAIGKEAKALKEGSIAIGTDVKSESINSITLGQNAQAKGDHSFAMGSNVTANSNSTIAIGDEATALQSFAIAIGKRVKAENFGAIAIGVDTRATGQGSFAAGSDIIAEAAHSTTFGRKNIGGGDPILWKEKDPLFEIGNGDHENPRNALTVLKNGNMGITTHTPQVKLHITGGTDANLSSGGYMIIGDKQGENLVFDNNEIIARKNVQSSTLYLQHNGGDLSVGGSVVHSSDRRLKKDITPLSYGLNEILQLEPKSYFWKDREQSNKSLGLIAQDVQPILKELVNQNDKDGMLSINYTELIPLLINAIKEQQTIIGNQNQKIETLTTSSNAKDDILTALSLRVKQIESLLKSNKL